jgi:hypothetical protein
MHFNQGPFSRYSAIFLQKMVGALLSKAHTFSQKSPFFGPSLSRHPRAPARVSSAKHEELQRYAPNKARECTHGVLATLRFRACTMGASLRAIQ